MNSKERAKFVAELCELDELHFKAHICAALETYAEANGTNVHDILANIVEAILVAEEVFGRD